MARNLPKHLFGFTSRQKAITIDNSAFGSNLRDYQVKIVLDQNSFDFASLRPDELDLCFTDTSGNSLPHWIEVYDSSGQNAVIWVKVPSIPALEKTTIYLFYGSPSSVRSNGDATFDLFDDFNTLPSAWVKSGPVLTPTQTWEGTMVRDPSVLYQSDRYNMWYWNDSESIGYATSPDGVSWTKYSDNPVFTNVLRPSVVYKSGTYYLFYAKTDETAIGLATSTNPQGPFTDRGLVLLATQTWESGMIRGPSVCYDTDAGLFKLWYSAGSISPADVPWTEPAAIGYATSPDGITWTKYANNPIMQGLNDGSWLSQAIETLRVYKLDRTYYGFYHGADYWGTSRIGLTTSSDGITWNPQASDLILDLGKYGEFDSDFLYTTAPVYNNGWKLWYNGRNSDNTNPEVIGLATLNTNIAQLNTSKWTRSRRCEVSVANSVARFTMFASTSLADDAHDYFVWSAKQFQDGIFEARVQIPNGYSKQHSLVAIGSRFNGTYHDILNSINPTCYGNMALYEFAMNTGTLLSNKARTGKFVNSTETIFTPYYSTTISRDIWYILKLNISGSNIKTYIDDILTYSGTDESILQQGSLFLRILETDGLVDWVRFRKHADTEPIVKVESQEIP
jgi:hypothetical protein